MARKLKEEYGKWGFAISLEKNKICIYGRRKGNFKIWWCGRNKPLYRLYLFSNKNRPLLNKDRPT